MNDFKKVSVYDLNKNKFCFLSEELPIEVSKLIELDSNYKNAISQVQSKLQSGLPKFKLLNQNTNLGVRNFKNGN